MEDLRIALDGTIKVATFNVQTLKKKKNDVEDDLNKCELDLLGLSSTLQKAEKRRISRMRKHLKRRKWYNGGIRRSAAHRRGGVTFLVGPRLRKHVTNYELVDESMIVLECGAVAFIQVYAPVEGAGKDEYEVNKYDDFLSKLSSVVERLRIERRMTVIVMGDFNAHVGRYAERYRNVLGRHGRDPRLTNGRKLLQFCEIQQLKIANTFETIGENITYRNARGNKSLIDFVLIPQRIPNNAYSTKVNIHTETNSDHYMLQFDMPPNCNNAEEE